MGKPKYHFAWSDACQMELHEQCDEYAHCGDANCTQVQNIVRGLHNHNCACVCHMEEPLKETRHGL